MDVALIFLLLRVFNLLISDIHQLNSWHSWPSLSRLTYSLKTKLHIDRSYSWIVLWTQWIKQNFFLTHLNRPLAISEIADHLIQIYGGSGLSCWTFHCQLGVRNVIEFYSACQSCNTKGQLVDLPFIELHACISDILYTINTSSEGLLASDNWRTGGIMRTKMIQRWI